MIQSLDFTSSTKIPIEWIDEEEAASTFRTNEKKWSFSNIYYLSELRDVYLALQSSTVPPGTRNFKRSFTEYCHAINLPFQKTPWNERRILEYLNALKNYGIVNSDFSIRKPIFATGRIGEKLGDEEKADLEEIFFSYFRFRELLTWLIQPPIRSSNLIHEFPRSEIYSNSSPIFFFSERGRFSDNFFYELKSNATLYQIREADGELARFWDVFVTWGRALGLLEKFTFKYPQISTAASKPIGCCYAVSPKSISVDLVEYLQQNYSTRFIYLPELVLRLALENRVRIEDTKQFVMLSYTKTPALFSLERTSEIFISRGKEREGDKILFPRYKDSYVSHLIVRR